LKLQEGITNQLEGGDIIRVLAVKCSHLLFGKEHLQALLQEIAEFKRIGNEKMLEASLSLLMVRAFQLDCCLKHPLHMLLSLFLL
jgi:hypothetical protein